MIWKLLRLRDSICASRGTRGTSGGALVSYPLTGDVDPRKLIPGSIGERDCSGERPRSRQAVVAVGRVLPAPGFAAVAHARGLQRGVRRAGRTSSPDCGGVARARGGAAARGAVVSLAT